MTKILLTGKTGQIGFELQRSLAAIGQVVAFDRAELDLSSVDAIRAKVRFSLSLLVTGLGGRSAGSLG